jgi:hypothetical protein
MNIQTQIKDTRASNKPSGLLYVFVVAAAFNIMASLELVIMSPSSVFGWLGLVSGAIVYIFCFALAIGDTKNWDSTITHNG